MKSLCRDMDLQQKTKERFEVKPHANSIVA